MKVYKSPPPRDCNDCSYSTRAYESTLCTFGTQARTTHFMRGKGSVCDVEGKRFKPKPREK